MYYRGTPKKRLYLLASKQPIQADAELLELNDGNATDADLITFSNSPTDSSEPNLQLAILNTKAVESDAHFVMSNAMDSFLQIQSLPYT